MILFYIHVDKETNDCHWSKAPTLLSIIESFSCPNP